MSLNNFFKQKQQLQKEKEENDKQQKKEQLDQKRNIQSVQLKARASQRIETFQETMMSKQYVDSLKNGSYPLLPISKHSFRDREKEQEMEKIGGIYLRTQQIPKIRAQTAQQEFRSGHLATGEFDPNIPTKNHEKWLKPKDLSKQGEPMRFGMGQRTEVEKANQEIKKISEQLDVQDKDLKMLIRPSWKNEQKEKWLDNHTFNIYPCLYDGHRSDQPWEQHPINLDNQNNQYIDGYDVIGDLSRQRFKEKEHKRTEFISTVKEDQIGTTINISRSLRTMKQDKILNMQSNYDEYSTNKQIEHYKTTLLQTKSIDHVTPHQHSNNYKGHSLHNLRPQQPNKLYRQSVNYLNQKVITKQPPQLTTIPQNNFISQEDQPTQQMLTADLFIPKQKLTQIQEVSQIQIQSHHSNNPFSRESLASQGGTRSRFMDQYKQKKIDSGQMKLGYPYRLEDDQTTSKIIVKYFQEEKK
ncbi:unnamed protein product [Paramecium sonneborni]|uniref:Uncharacterized protein n=1 Tax=Paramecium sonneborni TaxID=65129 RepID=A0A8S1MFY4_9CILI|nr:unnamed protein product [Paramecium sonneborni]